MRLDVNALDGVDQDQRAVAQPSGGGDFAAEVHVARGVYDGYGVVSVVESNGGALHCDGAPLFLEERVHVSEPAGEFGVDYAAVGAGD